MKEIQIFTIGFTKKTARQFFTLLQNSGAKRIVDVRLNNSSQLSGFAKKEDLKYFLQAINGMEYIHLPELAPTKDILDAFKKNKGPWDEYEKDFISLLTERKIGEVLQKDLLDGGCLLCSEETPDFCHRRLVAEYLCQAWGNVKIEHLV